MNVEGRRLVVLVEFGSELVVVLVEIAELVGFSLGSLGLDD